jgi:hypothetical protein
MYYFTLALVLLVYLFLRRLLWSPFGRALAGIRVNEHRMRAMGFATFGYKLSAFTLAGAIAGLAGYLWGVQTEYINPDLMGFHTSAHAIMMVILGGMGNFAGAIVGAFTFEYVLHVFKDLPDYRRSPPGQALAAVDGQLHRAGRGVRAARRARHRAGTDPRRGKQAAPMPEVLLSASNLTKRFGGLAAVDNVSLDLCATPSMP